MTLRWTPELNTRGSHTRVAPLTGRTAAVVGATGTRQPLVLQDPLVSARGHLGTGEFLSLPNAPFPCWVEAYGQSWGVQTTFAPKPASLTLGANRL